MHSIFKLINEQIHFGISKYCIKTMANLAENFDIQIEDEWKNESEIRLFMAFYGVKRV